MATQKRLTGGGLSLSVRVYLTSDDLEQIAERYADEHGEVPPSMTHQKFVDYCRSMVLCAVGAAGAGGWEEGVV